MNSADTARDLIALLAKNGISAFIFKVAQTGSVYVHFTNSKIGKLRVGDHDEKINLGYRWQLRLDIDKHYVINDKGHNQFFYPVAMIENLVNHINNYRRKIEVASAKRY